MATAQPRGLLEDGNIRSGKERIELGKTYPPYVLPCSPGWMQSMMSLFARTAETG